MKKLIAFASLFVMVFGLAIAITLTSTERAEAFPIAIYCSFDTGPNCTTQTNPYYLYIIDRTGRHFVGCCSGGFPY
jgi:hypothetical protein